jgi:hypothetical protein
MKPVFDLNRLLEEQRKKNRAPGDATHVGEHINLSLQTKPINKGEGVKK